jgi:hypothetical protein
MAPVMARPRAARATVEAMPGNPLTDPNWANEVTDQVTELVGKVRDTATDKAIVAVRAIVFGLLGVVLGIVLLVLVIVAATRGVQAAFDTFLDWPRAVYVSYFVVGGILTLAGLLVMGKRTSA